MSAFATSFILFIAGLFMQASAITVGNCNLTYFISGGHKCQRQMVTNLQTNPDTNCRYEYGNEKDCMKKHIKSCLTGSLVSYVDLVTSLLLHQVYHCGDVKYIPSPFDAVIMKEIKCKQEAFMDTDFCWSYFRDRLNANRSDPLLCREYALAKECITEKAKANCEIRADIKRDTYNPFCPNKTDPELHVNRRQDLDTPLSCTAYTIYEIAGYCEKRFLSAFLGKEKQDCGTAYTALRKCLDELLSKTCKDYASDQWLQNNIKKAVTTVLRGRRFFCEPVSLQAIDLEIKVRPLFPCNPEFLPQMAKCAAPLRKDFRASNNATGELCRNFKVAVECSNTAQKSHCDFERNVGDIILYPYSEFCTDVIGGNQNRGTKSSLDTTSFSKALYFVICALVLQLLQKHY